MAWILYEISGNGRTWLKWLERKHLEMDGLSWMKQKRFGIVNNINLLMKGNGWTRNKLEKQLPERALNC